MVRPGNHRLSGEAAGWGERRQVMVRDNPEDATSPPGPLRNCHGILHVGCVPFLSSVGHLLDASTPEDHWLQRSAQRSNPRPPSTHTAKACLLKQEMEIIVLLQ